MYGTNLLTYAHILSFRITSKIEPVTRALLQCKTSQNNRETNLWNNPQLLVSVFYPSIQNTYAVTDITPVHLSLCPRHQYVLPLRSVLQTKGKGNSWIFVCGSDWGCSAILFTVNPDTLDAKVLNFSSFKRRDDTGNFITKCQIYAKQLLVFAWILYFALLALRIMLYVDWNCNRSNSAFSANVYQYLFPIKWKNKLFQFNLMFLLFSMFESKIKKIFRQVAQKNSFRELMNCKVMIISLWPSSMKH